MAMHLLTMTLYQGKNQINCPLQWQCTFKTMTPYQGKIRNNYSAYDPNILYTRLPPQIPCYASSLEIESQIGFKLKYIYVYDKWTLSVCKNIKVYCNLYSLNVQDKWTLISQITLKTCIQSLLDIDLKYYLMLLLMMCGASTCSIHMPCDQN